MKTRGPNGDTSSRGKSLDRLPPGVVRRLKVELEVVVRRETRWMGS